MPRRHVHRGFSFVELLFAMAILSFGIIGVAASLYVGVGQTVATLDETNAAAIARGAAAVMGQVMNRVNTIDTANTFLIVDGPLIMTPPPPPPAPADTPSLTSLVRPMQIDATDAKYAWAPIYRHADGPTADIVIFVLRASARSAFGPADLVSPNSTYLPGLAPTPLSVDIQIDSATNETVLHVSSVPLCPGGAGCIVPGAIVFLNGGDSSGVKGRVVRISGQLGLDTWSLVPGEDLAGVSPTSPVAAFAVGRGYRDPAHPELGYDGSNQAIAAYATTVLLR